MLTPLTEKEIEFLEFFHDPTALTECLIPENLNAPQTWLTSKGVWLRPYQLVMQNYSYMYANDPDKSAKENFEIKKGAGDCYQIGSRNTGKSYLLVIDIVLSIVHKVIQGCVASFDAKHLRNVTQPVAGFIESHKFLQLFHLKDTRKKTVNRDPLTITTEHGSLIRGVNEQVGGNNPGVGYHALHAEIHWYEEASYLSEEGWQKSVDAGSSLGRIERLSGIPDLRIGSPLTKILSNDYLHNWIWRLPQMVREDWTEKTRQEKIAEYEGESSAGYRLNVLAETIEGAAGAWDMKRLKEACWNKKKRIKLFEVDKGSFPNFESKLIIERLPGTEQVFICSDIGTSQSPSEVIILFFDGKKYKYIYRISLFKLRQKEQAQVLKWIYDKLGGGFIATDATHDAGVTSDYLYDMGIPSDHLLKVKFNENIPVDFERDKDNNTVLLDNEGEPIMKLANTIEWSMHELEHLFYDGLIELPMDEKLFKELNGYIINQVGTKKSYGSTTTDHIHQSFQVFSICRFFNQFNPMKNLKRLKRSFGTIF